MSSPILRCASSHLAWSVLSCLALGGRISAQGLKLNGPLARPIGGDIRSSELSRDGARLVYVADQDVDERFDLYSVDARAPTPLSVRLDLPHDFADVQPRFSITPDASRVVYRADQDVDGVLELFVVPIDGSALPRKLNGTLIANGDVDDRFQISPDGRRVLYIARQESTRFELFSASLDGSTPPVRLSPPMPAGSSVVSFSITADSRRVVLLAPESRGQELVNVLHSVPIDGRAGPVRLLERVHDGYLVSAGTSPRASGSGGTYGKHVFAVAQTALEPTLYSVPILGGTPLRLTTVGSGRTITRLALAAKDTRVVFTANPVGPSRYELFSVPSDGSVGRRQLSAPASGPVDLTYSISPDGKRAVYVSDVGSPGVFNLYSVTVDGSAAPVRLNGPSVPGGDVLAPNGVGLEISPDGTRVAYIADQDADEVFELFSVPIAGGASNRLNGALPPAGDVVDFDVTPDSSRAVYMADEDADEVFELFVVPLDGHAAPAKVSASLAPERDVQRSGVDGQLDPLRITPDGLQVIYLADQDTQGVVELYRAPLDASQVTTRMNERLAEGPVEGDVVAFDFAADGKHIAYFADQEEDDVFELYSVRHDGRGSPVKLSGDMVAGGDILGPYFDNSGPIISPDGSRVVYRADQETDEVDELYSVPMDGSAPPVKLSGVLVPQGDVTTFLVDPTGHRVTFRADAAVDERFELFGAPIDGSAPAVRLSGTMVPGGALQNQEIVPDGTRVVYGADQDVNDQIELYSVPIDGVAAPVKLNGTLVAGDVFVFQVSLDSSWVAFAAAQEAVDREEIYVVPIDASAPPVRLGSSLPGEDVDRVLLTPDAARALWITSGRLFVAPRDGSQPPLQLSAGESLHYEYGRMEFSANGRRLIYSGTVLGNLALFSVRVNGTAPRVQLSASGEVVENEAYSPILVSPAGRVVYLARVAGARGTFSAPVDGSAAPVRLAPVSAYDPTLQQEGKSVFFIGGGELLRAPIDGSAPPEVVVRAARPVSEFEIGPRGDRVAFLLGSPYLLSELFLGLVDPPPLGVAPAPRPR